MFMPGGWFGMGSRKTTHHHKKQKEKYERAIAEKKDHTSARSEKTKRLEIVLKCDTSGCAEAITSSISSFSLSGVEINVISSGLGAINKSDIFMAETGSRLIIGFNVGLLPHIDQTISEHNVELRLYDIIYKLLEDLENIAKSLIPQEYTEEIVGSARVIALFKSSRKGSILGCEVLTGKLVLGHSFRILGAMGLKYTGMINSLHIEKSAIREATKGQQLGLKIKDFNKAKLGDLVECFQASAGQNIRPWYPQGKVYYP
jgi:translation initiation factor IF-2